MAKANKHLTHLEDRIIIDGPSGGTEAIKILHEMGKLLTGKGSGGVVTTKWDGAPAVVCGVDPADGQFFVGTKSVFAKDAKICKTPEQIKGWYSGALQEKLLTSLQYLPQAGITGVLQGDLMFTNDKKKETIQGKRYTTFRPNTITYAAPAGSDLEKEIEAAKIGIVFHTKYTGNNLSDMRASFNVGDNDFKTGGDVWAEKAEFKDVSGVATFSSGEKSKYDAAVRRAEGSLKKASTMLRKIQSGKKTLAVDTEFLKFFNNYVKAGRPIPSVDKAFKDFFYHLGGEYSKVISKNKTLKAQANKAGKFIDAVAFLDDNQKEVKMVIAAYMNLQYAKNLLVEKMKKVSQLNLFVNMGDHYEVTSPEGFVAIVDGEATKLIDRLEFSQLNFTVPKQWD